MNVNFNNIGIGTWTFGGNQNVEGLEGEYMFAPMEGNFGNEKYGDVGNRIGNEIMIDRRDLT